MFGLLPKNLEFFDCFERSARNAVRAAELLAGMSQAGGGGKLGIVQSIIEAEHAGDQITHETLDRLEQTYLTPIDRDDIHRLITRIDDVVDMVDAIGQRMQFYKIANVTENFQQQAEVLVKATRLMCDAVAALRHLKDRRQRKNAQLDRLIIAVHQAEEEGDSIHHRVLATLFECGFDPFQVIKWKELHELLEQAIDFCDDVACQVHGIVLKNL